MLKRESAKLNLFLINNPAKSFIMIFGNEPFDEVVVMSITRYLWQSYSLIVRRSSRGLLAGEMKTENAYALANDSLFIQTLKDYKMALHIV